MGKLIIIAAVSLNDVIGINDDIPWKIPEDFKHFRNTTMGSTLIVGSKTYHTLPDKAFEGRKYLVLNGGDEITHLRPNVEQFSTLNEILDIVDNDTNDFYVIGGSMIYKLFIPHCDELLITWVGEEYENGNKFFPTYELYEYFYPIPSNNNWELSKSGVRYKIIKYKKK